MRAGPMILTAGLGSRKSGTRRQEPELRRHMGQGGSLRRWVEVLLTQVKNPVHATPRVLIPSHSIPFSLSAPILSGVKSNLSPSWGFPLHSRLC